MLRNALRRVSYSSIRQFADGREPDQSAARAEHSSTNVLEKYMQLKRQVTPNPAGVDPRGVFANNELNLSEIEVYGFDYDYTLAVYTEEFHYLIYDLGLDWLINKFKYPKAIGGLEYRPGFATRGLHYDIKEGILMKIDLFHQIQFESVYRGLTPMDRSDVESVYNGCYIPQYMIRSGNEKSRMKQLNDLFSVPEICLISNVTEYFIKNHIPFNPEILFYDVQSAVASIHPVIHNMLNDSNIGTYLEKYPELETFLQRLTDQNKKMFIVTNSPFKFLDVGMCYMMGPDWQRFFDVVIVQARKPKFFTEHLRPFRVYDKGSKSQLWERVTSLDKGQVYVEGTVNQLQKMTGWVGHSVLYFGDQIYNDLADLTLNYGWRTGAILCELAHEIRISNSEAFRHTVGWLQSLQHIIEDMQDDDDCKDIVETLLNERDMLRQTTKSLFNPNFGSVFRTHHNPTYFSRRLFRYSDIYTSHVTNLMNYSMKHVYYPRRGMLPHELYMPSLNY